MTERIVGIRILISQRTQGLGVMPQVPFPATVAERTFAAEEAAKAAVLLESPSPGQTSLFRHLVGSTPGAIFVLKSAQWVGTILKATEGLSEDEMNRLLAFDWTERTLSPGELRGELIAFLNQAQPPR